MPDELGKTDLGQTPIDADELRELIPSLSTRDQLNAVELQGINSARAWAMSRRVLARSDLLSDGFCRELHRRMFRSVWKWAGRYRINARNLGWESHRIAEGVRVALDDANYWFKEGTYPPHESAIRLHHRLVAIHPWVNGNGRHARLLADILLAARKETPLPWGSGSNSLSEGINRQHYLEALQQADNENFRPLVEFCRQRSRPS